MTCFCISNWDRVPENGKKKYWGIWVRHYSVVELLWLCSDPLWQAGVPISQTPCVIVSALFQRMALSLMGAIWRGCILSSGKPPVND